MNQVGSVIVNDKAVRLLLKALFEPFMVFRINAPMPLPKPFQRHVSPQHTHLAALGIVDMRHVGRRQLLRGRSVEIRRSPVTLLVFECSLIPHMLQVVRVVLVHLPAHSPPRCVTPSIDFVVMPLLRIEVWLEYQPATRHILVLSHHPLQMFLQFVRIVNIPLNDIDIVDGSHIHIRQDATDLLVGMQDDTLIARLHLTRHGILGNHVDERHDYC